MTFCI